MRKQPKVLPPSVIGLLGGGQLGRMIALDGRKMGYRFVVLDPAPNSPTGQVADKQIVAAYQDVAAASELSREADVITYEFENVDADVARALEQDSLVPQGSQLLATTQHRVKEKSTLAGHGLPVTPFLPVFTVDDLQTAYEQFDGQLVVKTCRGGYDGKGQWMVRGREDFEKSLPQWTAYLDKTSGDAHDAPLIAEQLISFFGELSVVVARNADGEARAFPPAENIHKHHILHLSIVPARYSEDVIKTAQALAEKVVTALDVVGLIAIEMFVCEDGTLYINELAPRPHNSGHYTMDACMTSQFEQHVRAVCNLPLGDTQLFTPVVMVNILGQHLDKVLEQMHAFPGNVKVHLYGKAESRTDRKMGHINVLCESVDEALTWIESTGIWSE